jgi:hypothetical protein
MRSSYKALYNLSDRDMRKDKIVTLMPHLPCPCGSGRRLDECCLLRKDQLWKRPPLLLPPAPKTNHQQPGCYLGATGDCSADLSGEHYISRTILEQIEQMGDGIAIKGMRWLEADQSKAIGINALTAKILCSRHNSIQHCRH